MAKLHENTDFDPELKATQLVAELEREALDEEQVANALGVMRQVFDSRVEACIDILRRANEGRLVDRRRDLLKARVKGVKPVGYSSGLIQPAGVIPTKVA